MNPPPPVTNTLIRAPQDSRGELGNPSGRSCADFGLPFTPVNFPLWARIGIGIGLAGTLAYITTPFAIIAARRFAFYDRPAGYKGHAAPTPYLGGAAVMLAYAIALLVGAGDAKRTLPLLGGVAVLFVVGTIDDRRMVPPLVRVAVEFGLGML